MRSREEQREERRQYEADVWYEVWRSGGDPDRVSPDRVDDYYYDSVPVDHAASKELQRQKPIRPDDEQESPDEQCEEGGGDEQRD